MKDDGRPYSVIMEAWENITKAPVVKLSPFVLNTINTKLSFQRLNAQELFDKLCASSKKLDEKEDDRLKGKADNEDSGLYVTGENGDNGDSGGKIAAASISAKNTEFDLPENIPTPTVNPTCECAEHPEHKDDEIALAIPAKRAFDLIFGNSPQTTQMWAKFFASRGETNVVTGDWVEPATGTILGEAPNGALASKILNFTMPVNAPMVKVKEAAVESILYLIKKVEYFVYVVEKRSATPALPYSDSFVPIVRYCITWTGKSSCKVMMFTGVKFYKSVMVKGIIKSQTITGSAAFSVDLGKAIKEEVNTILGKENPKKASNTDVGESAAVTTSNGESASQNNNGTASSSSAKNESILPFDLSNSYMAQWSLVAILGVSLFLNFLSLLKGGRSGTVGGRSNAVSIVSLCNIVPQGQIDWRNEILPSSPNAGTLKEKSVLGYLSSHYPDWNPHNCNSSSTSPWQAGHSDFRTLSHFPLPAYNEEDTKNAHVQLQATNEVVNKARQEVWETLRWLDEIERAIFWAGYYNWLADGVVVVKKDGEIEQCKEVLKSAGQYLGSCTQIGGVLAEMERQAFLEK
ncbi:hypothetical protein HK100_008869 [Physocladia obscura]|uniref:VASt domain-containing protein n=1 Tax=Physocladia obscura TaxID=109957 RepID=A0AAD5T3P6_9FUNG|nr:hypothetical protein HK100_008869 [Physocladia obscura]